MFRRFSAALTRILGGDWPWIAAVLLVALAAAWPAMSQPGLLNTRGGGDSPFLLQRLHQLTAALASGHFPVRWMPDANYGYGYPFYNYYAPLSIYIAAAFRFLGFSFVRAIHLAQLAGFVVAGLGMYCLGRRRLGSRWAGLLAAVAYTVAPFHMVNVYVRGDSLAEFWAMAFYPLVLLAADGVLDKMQGSRGEREQGSNLSVSQSPPSNFPLARPIAFFALAYAALILSHNISALIFTPFLLLYLLVRLLTAGSEEAGEQSPNLPVSQSPNRPVSQSPNPPVSQSPVPPIPPSILFIPAALLLALALAAWFFIPALAEQDLAQLGPVTEGYFHFSNHFRGLDLVQGGLFFNYNPDGGVAFRLGLLQAALAVAGAGVLLWRAWTARKARGSRGAGAQGARATEAGASFATRHSSLVILLSLIAVFMITPLSRPLWDHLPLLPFTQFPWRFLSVASFFMAFLTGGLVLAADRPPARAAVAVTGSLVLLAAGLLGLRVDHLIVTDADVTAERLAQYEWFTGNIGTTVSAEYLTPESSPRPWTSAWLNTGERDYAVATTGELSAGMIDREATSQAWRLATGGAEAVFPTLFWPGWQAAIDGQATGSRALPSSGLTTLAVPAGEHTVTLELDPTPVRLAAELLSAIAAIITGALLIMGKRAGKRSANAQSPVTSLPVSQSPVSQSPVPQSPNLLPLLRGLSSVACALLLLAFLWRNDPRELPPGDLTWDFAQMAYLHHDTGGVGFDNGARLHQYGYSAGEIAAGQTLTVTLSVEPGEGGAATLSLVTPASARPTPDGAADPPAVAAATRPLNGDSLVFTLAIPAGAPPGLYVPRLTIDDARPLMPSGATRGDLFLRPVRVSGGDLRPPGLHSQSPGSLDVRALSLTMRDAATLDGRFAWYTARPLGARYQFSWRLQDPAGGILAQLDAQPGYGYQPSTLWPAGRWTADWLALRLPDAAPAVGDYPLVMRLYDATTGDTVLMRRVGTVAWDGGAWRPRLHQPSFALPDDLTPVAATFGKEADPYIALRGYELEQEGDTLRLALYWEALRDVSGDYTRFVHLIDAAGNVAAQVDGAPAAGSYPTGQWVAGEVITDSLAFDLSGLPPGAYRPAMGFYEPQGDLPRLPAFGPDGPLPDDRLILPESITIPAP